MPILLAASVIRFWHSLSGWREPEPPSRKSPSGNWGQPSLRPATLNCASDAGVERGEIGEADGPVFAETVVVGGAEFEVRQAERLAGPEEGPASDQTDADPVVAGVGRMGIGDLAFVDPSIGVVLVGLEDVGMESGLAEAAVGEIVRRFVKTVAFEIGDRAGVEHKAADAEGGEGGDGRAAGVAGADNENVVGGERHGVEGFWLTAGGIDGDPVEAGFSTAAASAGGGDGRGCVGGGVGCGGAEVGAEIGEEMLVGVGPGIEGPRDDEGLQDLVSFSGGEGGEILLEEALSLGGEVVEAVSIEELAGRGGNGEEEIEELGRSGFECTGEVVVGRLEEACGVAEGIELGGSEK